MIITFKPIIGILIGLFIINCRNVISKCIQITYEKFPKYKASSDDLKIKLSVKPLYIAALGITVCMFSICGLIMSMLSNYYN
jgi:hypothetical protein